MRARPRWGCRITMTSRAPERARCIRCRAGIRLFFNARSPRIESERYVLPEVWRQFQTNCALRGRGFVEKENYALALGAGDAACPGSMRARESQNFQDFPPASRCSTPSSEPRVALMQGLTRLLFLHQQNFSAVVDFAQFDFDDLIIRGLDHASPQTRLRSATRDDPRSISTQSCTRLGRPPAEESVQKPRALVRPV